MANADPVHLGFRDTVVDVYPGANTADVRILASVFSGGVAARTPVEQTGMTTTTTIEGLWTVSDGVLDPPASPIGHRLELVIQARRSAGATAIAVAPRVPAVNIVT